ISVNCLVTYSSSSVAWVSLRWFLALLMASACLAFNQQLLAGVEGAGHPGHLSLQGVEAGSHG
uniref:hypothetical protein n=1 Tax=Serratia marcescens TaxID=615 RepID=UPI0019535A64